MAHKFSPQKIERLLAEDRLGGTTPAELLKENGLGEGMVFADIGCGPGFFDGPAAEVVGPAGVVYAVDTQQEMLDELEKRVDSPNIIPVRSEENHIPIDDRCVDFVLLAYVLHEAESKPVFLKEVRRIMKDGGGLLLIDWEKKVEDKGPPLEERVSCEEAAGLLEGAGFVMEKVSSLNPSHYILKAKKGPEGPR